MLKLFIGIVLTLCIFNSQSAEMSLKGIVDLRAVHVTSDANADSYLAGDYGKFRFNTGSELALGQLGLQYKVDWQNNWSSTVVGNGFADQNDTAVGITEAYLQYKGLPNANGLRISGKAGIYYPHISIENIATAWSTPYTITSSTINNWLGEEIRNSGFGLSVEKLGKQSRSPHSFIVDLDLFQNNDSAGAMLTWHGWTVGSRQTLLHERLVVQQFPAREGMLADQAAHSDPFIELDHRWGFNVSGQWRYKNTLRVQAGYYDNQAKKGIVEKGQYTWTTAFSHASFKYKFAKTWELMGQFMQGNTLMNSPQLTEVVNNDFNSQYLMLRKFWGKHHIALRAEYFNVDDLDQTIGDNNNESGHAYALAYRYRLSKQSFVLGEYTHVDSSRWSRRYQNQPIELTERQYQLSYRHYF